MLEIRPIVVNDDMIVLGGNMRLRACTEAGLKEVPIIKASDLTAEQQAEFIIKDNVGFGEWNWDALANEWETEQLAEWGLDVPDFAEKELEAEEDNYEIPDEVQTDIVLGDLFEIGEHRLLCGDSTDSDAVARLMDGEKIQCVVTDPPYGMAFQSNHRKEKHKAIANDQSVDCLLHSIAIEAEFAKYIWCRWDNVQDIPKPKSLITWVKNNWSMGDLEHEHARQTEVCAFYPSEKHKWPNKRPTDVIMHDRTNNELHPTQKPVTLMQEVIEWTIGNIYDPFLGSGSTMVAAHQLKRKCYGMELDPKYCQVIIDRMLKLDPTLKVKRNGQPYLKQG